MTSLIYARSVNHCIGDNGRIPWHLLNEFSHFENSTMGKPVIMGRKTYEDHKSALPGRRNIVIANDTVANRPSCFTSNRAVSSLRTSRAFVGLDIRWLSG